MKAALFERLKKNPSSYSSYEDLYESIKEEIYCILDRQSLFAESMSGISNYIPDLSPYDQEKIYLLEVYLKKNIERYEPRLKKPSVKVQKFIENIQSLAIEINGYVVFEEKIELMQISILHSKQ
ncbi:hypothetical protein [Candidatus Nesciobacter abundans]|uniref:IraD/Gp25-like domain-containing protein n=1 Tax=Candidatus Nesciobacter abundans TaxID=2601668 RepID=A0A5C0UGN3_9PROT|nr:hypothetical protein [Candidatus Nesciobacter abundans]QEK38890.1 hypothetical protein FZC36_00345 [Candidatus Nesciobacter abundans]